MTLGTAPTARATEPPPAVPIGLAKLAKLAFDGVDLDPLWQDLLQRAIDSPQDAATLMDLSTIAQLRGQRHERLVLQTHALEAQRLYRQPAQIVAADGVRVLALMTPGDFMANAPIEFLLQDSSVTLDILYVIPGLPLPHPLPEHDVAFAAVTELDGNQAAFRELAALVPAWPRPVVNRPDRVVRLSRDGTWNLLKSAPGVVFPINIRIDRTDIERVGSGDIAIEDLLDGAGFPIVVRPIDSNAGHGLAKLDTRAAIESYLLDRPEPCFYVAPFVDYRSPDGLFRKYRVALIAGRPYACHMAVSEHWMIHYLNAGMAESAAKRAEEARFMAKFDSDFGLCHAAALAAIAERIGLDYVAIDCAETPHGRLLVFEAGTNMIVHAMDSPTLYPYKRPQMAKVFAAFQAMLRNVQINASTST
jgi:hypothetical protein